MFRNRCFKEEPRCIARIVSRLFPVVLARAEGEVESPHTHTAETYTSGNANSNPINFEQLVAQARKEEKDKLYPRIKKLEDENAALLKSSNDSLLKIAALTQEIEKIKGEGAEKTSAEVKELEKKLAAAEKALEDLKKSAVDEEALRASIEKEYSVKLYIRDKVAENKDDILTILAEGITGSTEEEVDKAIQEAKEKTLSVKKDLGLVDESGNPVSTPQKKDKTAKVSNPNPAVGRADSELSIEYLRGLDPRSKEYAELRKKMGLR